MHYRSVYVELLLQHLNFFLCGMIIFDYSYTAVLGKALDRISHVASVMAANALPNVAMRTLS